MSKISTFINLLINKPKEIPHIFKSKKEIRELKYYYQYIQDQNIIWHICSPKSASTLLMNNLKAVISDNKRLTKNARMFRSGKTRNNIIDLNFFFNELDNKKINITTHSHSIITEDLKNCFSKKHKIIIQTRNILDTLVSLNYGMKISKKKFWMPIAEQYWDTKNIDHFQDLIFNYLPFHINFLNGWLHLAKNSDLDFFFIKYEEVINRNTNKKILKEIFSNFKSDVKINFNNINFDKSKLNNFNLGEVSRGRKEIPAKYIDEIKNKLINNDYFKFNLINYLD